MTFTVEIEPEQLQEARELLDIALRGIAGERGALSEDWGTTEHGAYLIGVQDMLSIFGVERFMQVYAGQLHVRPEQDSRGA